MFPAGPGSSPGAAPLPPLPSDLSDGSGQDGAATGQQSGLAGLMSGLAPVKAAQLQIQTAVQSVAKSNSDPAMLQICAKIAELAAMLLPQALQSGLNPMSGGPVQPVQTGPQPVPGV